MLSSGSTIGILGGGQLGRMMATAAAQLGYHVVGYAPPGDNVAAEVSSDFFEKGWGDTAALAAFASKCDVVTWEFENVPLAAIEMIPTHMLRPGPLALGIAQDRLKEKRFIEDLGGKPAAYAAVESDNDLRQAAERIGAPGILKTSRDGYDGKGQWRIASLRDVESVRFPGKPCVYEAFVDFDAEFSVILVRSEEGEVRFWDSTQNVHRAGMLATATLPPAEIVRQQVGQAQALARKVAEALGYVGVLTLEFFATADGPVFNEMAPRVHNSGHWTIEGSATSQFENHIRAICGLPLGSAATRFEHIEMHNIVGQDALAAFDMLGDGSEAHLHLYGKKEAREGRKMGHVTRVGRTGP